MSEENDKDLKMTQELYEFLQGVIPTGTHVRRNHKPKLTPDQAWTVVWYLGNLYWPVPDNVEKCDVCGELYHTHQGGGCLDYGKAPYHFCDSCMDGDEYAKKSKSRLNPENKRSKSTP